MSTIQYVKEVQVGDYPFPEMGEANILKEGVKIEVPPRSTFYVVTKLSALRRCVGLLKEKPMFLIYPTDKPACDDSLRYENDNKLFPTPTYVGIVIGKITLKGETFDSAIMYKGEPNGAVAWYALIKNKFPTVKAYSRPHFAKGRGFREGDAPITGLQGTDIVSYDCDEKSLLEILKSSSYPLVTKILSTLIFLFPYVKKEAIDYFVVAPMTISPAIHTSMATGLASFPTARISGELLSYLSFYSMCPAYSQENIIADQIFKRAKAIAANDGIEPPDMAIMKSIQNSSTWTGQFQSSHVDTVLGWALCRNKDMEFKLDVISTDMPTHDILIQGKHMSRDAIGIMEQLKMVYMNYHSTTIRFIPAFIDAL